MVTTGIKVKHGDIVGTVIGDGVASFETDGNIVIVYTVWYVACDGGHVKAFEPAALTIVAPETGQASPAEAHPVVFPRRRGDSCPSMDDVLYVLNMMSLNVGRRSYHVTLEGEGDLSLIVDGPTNDGAWVVRNGGTVTRYELRSMGRSGRWFGTVVTTGGDHA